MFPRMKRNFIIVFLFFEGFCIGTEDFLNRKTLLI